MRSVEARIKRLEMIHGQQQRPLIAVESEEAAEQYQGEDVTVVITGVPGPDNDRQTDH